MRVYNPISTLLGWAKPDIKPGTFGISSDFAGTSDFGLYRGDPSVASNVVTQLPPGWDQLRNLFFDGTDNSFDILGSALSPLNFSNQNVWARDFNAGNVNLDKSQLAFANENSTSDLRFNAKDSSIYSLFNGAVDPVDLSKINQADGNLDNSTFRGSFGSNIQGGNNIANLRAKNGSYVDLDFQSGGYNSAGLALDDSAARVNFSNPNSKNSVNIEGTNGKATINTNGDTVSYVRGNNMDVTYKAEGNSFDRVVAYGGNKGANQFDVFTDGGNDILEVNGGKYKDGSLFRLGTGDDKAFIDKNTRGDITVGGGEGNDSFYLGGNQDNWSVSLNDRGEYIFTNKETGGTVTTRNFEDYYYGSENKGGDFTGTKFDPKDWLNSGKPDTDKGPDKGLDKDPGPKALTKPGKLDGSDAGLKADDKPTGKEVSKSKLSVGEAKPAKTELAGKTELSKSEISSPKEMPKPELKSAGKK